MAGKTNIPQVRFSGFDKDWEKQKFDDILEKYEDPVATPHDGYERLGVRSHVKGTFHSYVAPGAELETAQMHRVAANKLLFNITFAWEHAVAVTDEDDAGKLVSHRFPQFTFASEMDPKFFRYVVADNKFRYHLWLSSPGGAGRNRVLSIPEMMEFQTYLPEKREQTQLSNWFLNLDNLIAQHESKLKKLQELKSSMLEKMFPKNDAEIPEMRFQGFVGVWSKTELCQIAYKVTEKNVQNLVSETFTNSAEHGIISQRDFFDHDISNSEKINGYYIVQDNDFVYNPRVSVTAPCGPINRNRLGRKGVMSPLYTVFRTHDIDPLYLEWYFKSPHWYAYMRFNGDSGARSDRFAIKNELFFQMPIPLPDIREQHKIGQALQAISDYIKLQQDELKKLQSLKKGLLEKMFV